MSSKRAKADSADASRSDRRGIPLSASRNSAGAEQDFEINLTSIIDCFTVLIAYLLVSASFISVGMFDVASMSETPALADGAGASQPVLTVRVPDATSIQLEAPDGFGALTETIYHEPSELGARLSELKARMPATTQIVLKAGDEVAYSRVVSVTEAVRRSFPQIYLGGAQ